MLQDHSGEATDAIRAVAKATIVLVGYAAGELTEGQAAKLLDCSIVEARIKLNRFRAAAQEYWRQYRKEHPVKPPSSG